MKKSWNLIPKILSGEKTIESRWYKNRITPWDKVKPGDTIYFKNAGEEVTAVASVSKVMQFEELSHEVFDNIIQSYGDAICLRERTYSEYYRTKNYCILMFLENAHEVKAPFNINKSGYGMAAAWLCVDDINNIKYS